MHGETTPEHIADRQYVVIVGVHDPEREKEQATDAFGPLGYDQALAFGAEVQAVFTKAYDEHGENAFPYGDPYFDVRLLRSGVTGTIAATNWIYQPDVHGDDPANPDV